MALVKFGGGVVQVSGSIGGTTFARNRSGNYMRSRTKPVNPNSPRQQAARTIMQFLTEEWGDHLTPAQRAAWENYAAAVSWLNALGETIKLTGFNHYIRSNFARLQVGEAQIEDGPVVLTLPHGDPLMVVTMSAASGVTVAFDDTLDWVDEDDGFLMIDLGRPQNATRNFFDGPYRFDSFVQGDSTTPPTTPAGPTATTTWSFLEGQIIWARAKILREDGRVSNHFVQGPITIAA